MKKLILKRFLKLWIFLKTKKTIRGVALLTNTIQANKFIDEEATQRRREEEMDKVEPVIIKEHQVIVRKGDIIDSNDLALIKESGLLKEKKAMTRPL